MMLADIGSPSSAQVAKTLRVTVDQVDAWRAADEAPHAAGLALFWLTTWGMSAVDAEISNAIALQAGLARAWASEVQQLRRELARVIALGDFGCANSPTIAAAPVFVVRARQAVRMAS